MKKIIYCLVFAASVLGVKAQYGTINAILDRLEAKKGINQKLDPVDFEDKKFVQIKEFDDHTERLFIIIKGKSATYVEIFDDKQRGDSSTNVFSGDVVKTGKNVVSLRFDKLENKRIAVPITKVMLLTKQDDILYLLDSNNKDRWIDEKALNKKK
ncbi:MAG: hypothetical protein JSS94_10025 [Bacteroidetes bacterium]|nr:hypothetical protein [Bacteroidota bacterium]